MKYSEVSLGLLTGKGGLSHKRTWCVMTSCKLRNGRSMDANKLARTPLTIYSHLGFMEVNEGLPVAWDTWFDHFEPSLSHISIGLMSQTDKQK